MKKSYLKLSFIILLFSFSLFGCLRSHESVQEEEKFNLQSFIYDLTVDALYSENQNNIYIPKSLEFFLNQTIVTKNGFETVFEYMFPNDVSSLSQFYFYDCHSDNGNWVDDIIFEYEEERIAAQLAEMENILSGVENENTQNENAEENNEKIPMSIEYEVTDQNRNLTYMTYGNELLIPQKVGNNTILIHALNDSVTRTFYDSIYRCYKEEKWNINSDNVEELISTTESTYVEDKYILIKKNTVSKDNIKNQLYNEKGLLIQEYNYNKVNDKNRLESLLNITYNKDDKITESSLTEYTYKDEKSSKLLYSFNKKYIYSYNKDDIPPNFDYYENNVLKVRNKYSAAGTYTSRIYFDDGYSVTTFYQDNKPIKEVYYNNDRVERVNNYEQ